MYESDRKAWVRYVPPRWIFDGTAICAAPSEVSRAMLRGWHANNGVLLGNLRLGFVCTKQTTDGQPGLEGYYYEHDRDLAPEERLRFAPGEDGPDFDPAGAPRLDADRWPPERRTRALRNYAMAYIRTILPELVALFGPAEAQHLGGVTGRLIGMQYYAVTAERLGLARGGAEKFGEYLARLGRAQGDDSASRREGDTVMLRQTTWKLFEGVGSVAPAVFDAWNELWAGSLSVHDRHLRLVVTRRPDEDDGVAWSIRPRSRGSAAR
jgi:hypothetical protein